MVTNLYLFIRLSTINVDVMHTTKLWYLFIYLLLILNKKIKKTQIKNKRIGKTLLFFTRATKSFTRQ